MKHLVDVSLRIVVGTTTFPGITDEQIDADIREAIERVVMRVKHGREEVKSYSYVKLWRILDTSPSE